MVGRVLVGDVGVEAEAWIDAIAGVHLAGAAPALARPEELPIGTGRRAVTPDGRDRQGVVGVDDPRQRRLIGVVSDEGVRRPDQLVSGHALAGLGHARQAQIGGVGENGREQCVLVRTGLSGTQVGEGSEEAGVAGDLVQELCHPDFRQHGVDPVRENVGFGRRPEPHRADVQPVVPHLHAFQLAALETMREALEPPVQFPATAFQPGLSGRRQAEPGGDRLGFGRGQHVAIELAIGRRSLDPDVP